jgi:hypothetical protein
MDNVFFSTGTASAKFSLATDKVSALTIGSYNLLVIETLIYYKNC